MRDEFAIQRYPNHQVSVHDLWRSLADCKWWIIGFVAAFLAVSGIYLLLATPVFEVGAKIRVGQLGDARPLENPEVLAVLLLGKYGEDVATGVRRSPPFVKRATVQRGVPQVVDLVVRGDTPEQAAGMLRKVVDETVGRHDQLYEDGVSLARQRVSQIEDQIRGQKQYFEQVGTLFDEIRKKDPVQASLLALERGRIAMDLASLERELPSWKEKLSAPTALRTEVLGSISAPVDPVAPRSGLILLLAAGAGVLVGGLGAKLASRADG